MKSRFLQFILCLTLLTACAPLPPPPAIRALDPIDTDYTTLRIFSLTPSGVTFASNAPSLRIEAAFSDGQRLSHAAVFRPVTDSRTPRGATAYGLRAQDAQRLNAIGDRIILQNSLGQNIDLSVESDFTLCRSGPIDPNGLVGLWTANAGDPVPLPLGEVVRDGGRGDQVLPSCAQG